MDLQLGFFYDHLSPSFRNPGTQIEDQNWSLTPLSLSAWLRDYNVK